MIVYKMSMNKDAETNVQRQSYNVTSRTIQVSNRAVYNNNNNNFNFNFNFNFNLFINVQT
jgi:hypothetical protein